MKLKEDFVRYMTEAEVKAFKEQEHAERVALTRRVERGELTAEAANREASIFKGHVPTVLEQPVNYREVLKNLKGLRPRRKSHGR